MLIVEDAWAWDSWYVDAGDAYHVFFLRAPRALGDPELRHVNAAIGHAVSTDLRQWTILPDALVHGAPGTYDERATWTGCVVPHGDGWRMFYTGLAAGFEQRIAVADSPDLVSWSKHSGNPVVESDVRWYEPTAGDGQSLPAWRDPWVYAADGEYHMLITARAGQGPSRTRGVIGRARSPDLTRWRVEPPLTRPSDFAEMEVPQLIDVNGRDILIFSCSAAGLSSRRRDAGEVGGAYYLVLDGEPAGSDAAVPLDVPGLYACRIVWERSGEPSVIGFVDRDENSAFAGTLCDPIPLRLAAPALFR